MSHPRPAVLLLTRICESTVHVRGSHTRAGTQGGGPGGNRKCCVSEAAVEEAGQTASRQAA